MAASGPMETISEEGHQLAASLLHHSRLSSRGSYRLSVNEINTGKINVAPPIHLTAFSVMLCVFFSRGHCFAFCCFHSSAYLYFLTFPRIDTVTGDFPGAAKKTLPHLFFSFVLLIFIFLAVVDFLFFFLQLHNQRQSCSGIFCTGRGKTKDVKTTWSFNWSFSCVFFCLLPAGSVYLLRCVEAPEAVGHSGEWHLGQPAHVPAWTQGGGLALPLLHVRPCRVSPCKISSSVTSRVVHHPSLNNIH